MHVGENEGNDHDDEAYLLKRNLPVDPTHMNFLSLVQNPTKRLQICLKEYTMKLSFFLGADLIGALETVACVDLPVVFPEPDKSIFKKFIFYYSCRARTKKLY